MTLSEAQLDHYFEHGFLIVEDLLTADDLAPARRDIAGKVDELAANLLNAGLIDNGHAGLGFFDRLARIERDYPGAAVLFHISGFLGRGIAELWGSDKLIAIVAQMIGPDIYGHPVCNIRSKTPDTDLMDVPWHQDTAYLVPGADQTLQPTAWIPFLDATRETGCMQVVRGGHKSGVFHHDIERKTGNPKSWYLTIPPDQFPDDQIVTCEVPLGGVLFLNQLIPHRSLPNRSNVVRWSVDLRWQRPNEPSGWEGYLDVLEMRRGDDPAFRPDWDAYFDARAEAFKNFRVPGRDSFDITVTGPWLDRWEAAAANRDSG